MNGGVGMFKEGGFVISLSMVVCVLFCATTGAHALGGRPLLVRLGMIYNEGTGNYGNFTQAFGVSADGRWVVGGGDKDGFDYSVAFRFDDHTGEMIDFDQLQTLTSAAANATSVDGREVVGTSLSYSNNSNTHAFIWQEDAFLNPLKLLDANLAPSYANDITADGNVVVGSYLNAGDGGWLEAYRLDLSGPDPVFHPMGDLDDSHNRSDAYAISSDGSIIVGSSYIKENPSYYSGTRAWHWKNPNPKKTRLKSVKDYAPTAAFGISPDGSIIVGQSGYQACRWDSVSADPVVLELLPSAAPGSESIAYDASNNGEIVVGWSTSIGVPLQQEAVIWGEDNLPLSLNAFLDLEGVDREGFILTEARAISDDGKIVVGSGYDSNLDRSEAFLLRLNFSWGTGPTVYHDSDWLGRLYVKYAPWVWSEGLNKWLYIPELTEQAGEGWVFLAH